MSNVQPIQVLMFLPQGFEDLEAISIIDVFGWTHIRSHLTPIHLKTCAFRSHVVGKFGTTIKVDYTINEKTLDYRSVVRTGDFKCL